MGERVFFVLFAFIFSASISHAQNATRVPFQFLEVADTGIGARGEYGQCPCFRWTMRARAGSFDIPLGNWVISSENLFRVQIHSTAFFDRTVTQQFQIGALEALWRQGHIGIGFPGVTAGYDLDHNYTDIVRTGFYAIVSLIQSAAFSIGARTGYEFEQQRVNLGEIQRRHLATETIYLRYGTQVVSGQLFASAGIPLIGPAAPFDQTRLRAGASIRGRIFDIHGVNLGAGFEIAGENDPYRLTFGQAAPDVAGMLMIDLSYIPYNQRPRAGQ